MMTYASEEQKRRYLPPLASGEEIWCQLFSEPAGGSDLAGLRTRAEPAKDGSGDWIVNGQKIWTSGAQHAQFGILITRTDPDRGQAQGPDHVLLGHEEPRVSKSVRSSRSMAIPASTKSISPTCAFLTPSVWARSGMGGRSR